MQEGHTSPAAPRAGSIESAEDALHSNRRTSSRAPSRNRDCPPALFQRLFALRTQLADLLKGFDGAGGQGRTGDVQLGKLAFYH